MPDLGDYNPLDGLLAEEPESSTPAEPVQPEGAESTEGQGQPIADESSAVQPQEGQGQQDAQTGLYDLSTVPEEYRSHVEQHLKDIERNANAKFQEHAEFRKSWEPYSELGINEVDPQGLSALLEFAQALVDPETGELDPESAREAILGFAQSLEVDLNGDLSADDPEGQPSEIEQLKAELAELKQSYTGDKEQQEIAALRQQADQAYRAEFAEVEGLNGKPFSQEEKVQLIDLARRFQMDSDEPIKAAYSFINSISGKAEKALVDGQPTPPAPAEPSGRASSVVQPVDDFDTALRLHLERNASAS